MDSLSVIEEIAYQESAVGWCSMIFATTAHLGSFLAPAWGQKFTAKVREAHFGGITAGAAAPSGKAVVVMEDFAFPGDGHGAQVLIIVIGFAGHGGRIGRRGFKPRQRRTTRACGFL